MPDLEISLLREEMKAQQRKIIELEKTHVDLNERLESLTKNLDKLESEISEDEGVWLLKPPLRGPPGHKGERGNVGPKGQAGEKEIQIRPISVPIGFVYIQLPNQQAPSSLWPTFSWKSITSDYAGLFFRAEGGGSNSFGQTQKDQTNRITQIAVENLDCFDNNYKLPSPLSLPESGWSGMGRAGWYIRGHPKERYNCEGIKMYSSGGETRPKNTAIRIWKRTA